MALLRPRLEAQPAGLAAGDLVASGPGRALSAARSLRRAPELGGLVGLAAVLNLWALGQNGWANTYYAAAVRSMASSWHNFLYASLDPSGVMTVDKPPLALWVQALSVRVFGYHPLAILVPQALMGIVSVVLVYDLVRRRFGRLGGFVAGLALATTPIAVAMSRDNNPDALLTLCCVAAVWFAVRALEDGRTRWLVLSGIAAGLAFEAKLGEALVIVPGIALAWLFVALRGRLVALRQLAAGGAAMVCVGLAWPVLVWLTPAADRPYVAGTSDNSIWSLITGYDGFGRVTGQVGGPGGTASPTFGGGTGLGRLLNSALGGQEGWLLGAAIVGGFAVLVASRARRHDPRTGWIIAVGGTFLATALLFSFSGGIFHPYYVVLLAPFTAALLGAGVATAISGGVNRSAAGALMLAAGAVTEYIVLGDYVGQMRWLEAVLPAACGAAAIGLFLAERSRTRAVVLGVGIAALLIAPTVWAFDTLGYQTSVTFPAGGPASVVSTGGGFGGFPGAFGGGGGVGGARPPGGGGQSLFGPSANGSGGSLFGPGAAGGRGGTRRFFRSGTFPGFAGSRGSGAFDANEVSAADLAYVKAHGGGTLAVSSQQGAGTAIIDDDANVAGIGGFSGVESDPSIAWLASEVASGHIRFVIDDASGNPGSRPGATAALGAAADVCTPGAASDGTTIYDCKGKAAALRAISR
ncbi:MAG: ArnT family glycosyltransferase [Solirubrobacteraceae bacterium]